MFFGGLPPGFDDEAFGGMHWEGTCGCFETARGGPPCAGAYDGCAACDGCLHWYD